MEDRLEVVGRDVDQPRVGPDPVHEPRNGTPASLPCVRRNDALPVPYPLVGRITERSLVVPDPQLPCARLALGVLDVGPFPLLRPVAGFRPLAFPRPAPRPRVPQRAAPATPRPQVRRPPAAPAEQPRPKFM